MDKIIKTASSISIYRKPVLLLIVGIIVSLFLILNPLALALPLAMVFLSFFLFLFLGFFYESKDINFLLALFIIAILLRLIFCLFLSQLAQLKYGHAFFLGADDYGFGLHAMEIAQVWKTTGHMPEANNFSWMSSAGDLRYSYFISFLYFFIEENPLVPLFLNCILGAFCIFFIYSIANQIFDYKIARLSAIFVAFWPSLFLWSTQNLRESITLFLVSVFIWSVVSILFRFRLSYLIIGIVSFYSVSRIRPPVFYILLLSFIVAVLFFLLFYQRKSFLLASAILILSLIFSNFNFIESCLKYYFPYTGKDSIFNTINYLRQVRTISAGSAFLADFEISNIFTFLMFLPLGLLYAFFSPFPWQMLKISQITAVIEMFLWYFLIKFAFVGGKVALGYINKRKQVLFILVFVILGFIILALTEGNVGTLFRHRAFIWPFCLMFSAAGINMSLKKRKLA